MNVRTTLVIEFSKEFGPVLLDQTRAVSPEQLLIAFGLFWKK